MTSELYSPAAIMASAQAMMNEDRARLSFLPRSLRSIIFDVRDMGPPHASMRLPRLSS